MRGSLIRIGDAVSQLANTLIGGEANDSLSVRAYRSDKRWPKVLIDTLLSPLERDHCRKSHEADLARAEALIARYGPVEAPANGSGSAP